MLERPDRDISYPGRHLHPAVPLLFGLEPGRPLEVDREEPLRVAQAVQALSLRHAVITSVNRDELEDGGASVFAETIRQIRKSIPTCTVEVLIPDFEGNEDALAAVCAQRPDIVNHNIETVRRLFPSISAARQISAVDRIARTSQADGDENQIWSYPRYGRNRR